MAPALPLAPSNEPETLDDCDRLSHPLLPLVSEGNFATPMDEDDMGVQNQHSLVKDSQEMEDVLVDVSRSDLANPFLLQAIKTFESAGDNISTMGDADPFPLPDFDLPEAPEPEVVSEKVADEANIQATQARLERRCAFLQRRLRILQTRAIGKRISEEVILTFDKCTRGARKDGGGRPMGLKAFMKRIETTAALQASAASSTVDKPTYYHAGTSREDGSHSASVGIAPGTLAGLEDTAGALRSHLTMVNHQLDSDATASSSGAESNDEAIAYNNQHQQHMPM